MAEIPNRGVKYTEKISDIDKKQEKDNFIFCASQKMNLFKKNKEIRIFSGAGRRIFPAEFTLRHGWQTHTKVPPPAKNPLIVFFLRF